MIEHLSHFDWDNLIANLHDRQVVPILGSELLYIEHDGIHTTLEQHLARILVEKFRINPGCLPPEFTLNDVAWHYLLEIRGTRCNLYSSIRNLLRGQNFRPPPALRQLAEITDFSLYVTTTFDTLLEQALNEVRFHGQPGTRFHSYSLRNNKKADSNEPDDLKPNPTLSEEPSVFHLLGSISSLGDFVVTDEDALEFLYALQEGRGTPKHLFDRLRCCNLLLLGCNFPDWLTRFFLRIFSNNRMAEDRYRIEYVADHKTPTDPVLGMFLRNIGVAVYEGSTASEFVAELHARWLKEHEKDSEYQRQAQSKDAYSLYNGTPTCPGSVFLSYASEDRAAVLQLKTAIEETGIRVWFDQTRLDPGDEYDSVIRQAIEKCTIFIPCISAKALEGIRKPGRRYLKDEWSAAITDANIGWRSYAFIWPVLIDDTKIDDRQIPPALRKLHMQACPDGAPPLGFVTKLKENQFSGLKIF